MSCHVHYRQAMKHRLALIFGLTALTALLFAADLTAGSSGMPLSAVLNALWAGPSGQSPEALILWSLRLPMTLTALFVGAALALAGLQIQTITANALASPSTLGITSGASFGAALAITAGFTVGGELWLGTMTASVALDLRADSCAGTAARHDAHNAHSRGHCDEFLLHGPAPISRLCREPRSGAADFRVDLRQS